MGVIGSWSQALEDVAVRSLDFGHQVVNGVGNAVCRVWNEHPNNIVFASPIHRGLMRHVCTRLGTPPPSTSNEPPLPIGLYAFNVTYTSYSIPSDENVVVEEPSSFTCNNPYNGSIASFSYNYGNQGTPYFMQISVIDDNGVETTIYSRNLGSFSYPLDGSASVEIIDCQVSIEPDILPPEGIEDTITVNTTDIDGNVIINNEEYRITIPVINNEIRIPLTIDVGGVSVDIDIDGGSTSDSGGGGEGGGTDSGSSGINVRQPFAPGNYNRTLPRGGGNSGTVETPEEQEESVLVDEVIEPETVYLVVKITTLPIGGRAQIQRESEDSDYFAGYVVFYANDGIDLFQGHLNPIRKRTNIYEIPIWATGYRAYTVNGAKIKIANYSIPLEE